MKGSARLLRMIRQPVGPAYCQSAEFHPIVSETGPAFPLSTPAVLNELTEKYQVPAASPSIDVLVAAGSVISRMPVDWYGEVPK